MNHPKMSNITQNTITLLMPYTEGCTKEYTASELSEKTGIPQQTASRIMNSLADQSLATYRRQGRNKLYSLDPKIQSTRNLLEILENARSLNFIQSSPPIAVIIDDLKKHAETIIIFGSYAQGKETPDSDLDLLVLGTHDKDKIKAIKNHYPIEINEHYATYKEFSTLLKQGNPLAIEIKNSHMIFGNTSRIIEILLEA